MWVRFHLNHRGAAITEDLSHTRFSVFAFPPLLKTLVMSVCLLSLSRLSRLGKPAQFRDENVAKLDAAVLVLEANRSARRQARKPRPCDDLVAVQHHRHALG